MEKLKINEKQTSYTQLNITYTIFQSINSKKQIQNTFLLEKLNYFNEFEIDAQIESACAFSFVLLEYLTNCIVYKKLKNMNQTKLIVATVLKQQRKYI